MITQLKVFEFGEQISFKYFFLVQVFLSTTETTLKALLCHDYHKFSCVQIQKLHQFPHSVHSSTVSSSYSSVSDSELSICHLLVCTWLITEDPIGGFFNRIVAVANLGGFVAFGMRFSSSNTVVCDERLGLG